MIPAAGVHGDGQALRLPFQNPVDHLHVLRRKRGGIFTILANLLADLFIAQAGEGHIVQLGIGASCLGQVGQLIAVGLDQVRPEFLDRLLEGGNEILSIRGVGETVSGLCGKYDQSLLDLLLDWMSSCTLNRAKLVARVLQESQPTLIYEHPEFVRDVLNLAELISEDALEKIRSAISDAARSGVRRGAPGEPFPADLRMKQHCEQLMASLSRAEPAFDLYEGLLKYARYAIELQQMSKAVLEENED